MEGGGFTTIYTVLQPSGEYDPLNLVLDRKLDT